MLLLRMRILQTRTPLTSTLKQIECLKQILVFTSVQCSSNTVSDLSCCHDRGSQHSLKLNTTGSHSIPQNFEFSEYVGIRAFLMSISTSVIILLGLLVEALSY
jgi:hypothetical protein